jgi:hypothetical protein
VKVAPGTRDKGRAGKPPACPALETHEREIVARYTRRLAEQLAEEAGAQPGDVEAIGVAGALMGVQRALVGYVRSRVLAGRRGPN